MNEKKDNIDILTDLILDDLFLIKQLFFKIYTSGRAFIFKYFNIDMSGFWDTIHGKSNDDYTLFIKEPSLINDKREFFLFVSSDFESKFSTILKNKELLIKFLKETFELEDLTEENHLQIVLPFSLTLGEVSGKFISLYKEKKLSNKLTNLKNNGNFKENNKEFLILYENKIEPKTILTMYRKLREVATLEEMKAIQNPQLLYNFIKTEILNIGEYDVNEQIVDKIILNPKLLKRFFACLINDKIISTSDYGEKEDLSDFEILNYQNTNNANTHELFIVSKKHKTKKTFVPVKNKTAKTALNKEIELHRVRCNSYDITPLLLSNILIKLNYIGKLAGFENTVTKMKDFLYLSQLTYEYLQKTEN